MHARPDPRALAAALRLLAAATAGAAVGLVETRAELWRCPDASPTFAALRADAAGWRPMPAALAEALRRGGVARVDPRPLGFAAAFAAVLPLGGGHALLALDARPRRLTPGLAAALNDGALLVALLLPRRPDPPQEPRRPAPAVRSAVLPRAAAHRMIEAALRNAGATGPLALLMLDLDRFRAVNAALGTAAGDALLAVTGTRLERALGRGDRVVRLEGDRFVILTARAPSELRGFAQRVLETVRQPLTLAGQSLVMQASIGIVEGAAAGQHAPDLLLQADSALRQAKAEGRNRFALHEARLDAAMLDRSQLELDLGNAPGNGQMHLIYQPYVDLDSGAVSGVEALMRWHHPTRGTILPSGFIPLAEATGLILPLGTWALHAACRQAAGWPAGLDLAVNISALQFHQPSFTASVDAALACSGFLPERLELEITETVLMRDNPDTIAQLEALVDRGIRIALDDFGTGYSALAYLGRLPHHRIKLDRSFVQDLANPATADLIRAIIAQARANGVAITAEGVERPEQVAQVRAMGFTHAQGFATGAPMDDPAELLARLAPAP